MTRQDIVKQTLKQLKAKGLLNERAIKKRLNEVLAFSPLADKEMVSFIKQFLNDRVDKLFETINANGYSFNEAKPLSPKAITLILKTSLSINEGNFYSEAQGEAFGVDSDIINRLLSGKYIVDEEDRGFNNS